VCATASEPGLAVVVVNWNGRDVLPDCLRSLRDAGYPGLRVIVVDNASTDTSLAHARRRHPEVEILEAGANLRWAGGNNVALRRLVEEGLPQEYVLLLNNDTIVLQGSLERLVGALAAEPRAWAATPRICYQEDPARAWYDGGSVGRFTGWVRHDGIRQLTGRLPNEARFVEYGTGCALLLSRQAIHRCGLLDEGFYFYGEDADYSLRLREGGGEILHVPRALILHRVSASLGVGSPRRAYLRSRSHLKLLRRHWPARLRPVLVVTQIAYFAGHTAWHLWHGRAETALALLRGVLDELREGEPA
jgi:GT2 family glycosyltransferase